MKRRDIVPLSLQCPILRPRCVTLLLQFSFPVHIIKLVIRANAGESFTVAIKLCQIIGKQFILKQQSEHLKNAVFDANLNSRVPSGLFGTRRNPVETRANCSKE